MATPEPDGQWYSQIDQGVLKSGIANEGFEMTDRILDARWDDRSTLTVEEAGDVLGLSRATAYAAANAGTIPTVRIGRRFVVPRFALEKLLMGAMK